MRERYRLRLNMILGRLGRWEVFEILPQSTLQSFNFWCSEWEEIGGLSTPLITMDLSHWSIVLLHLIAISMQIRLSWQRTREIWNFDRQKDFFHWETVGKFINVSGWKITMSLCPQIYFCDSLTIIIASIQWILFLYALKYESKAFWAI